MGIKKNMLNSIMRMSFAQNSKFSNGMLIERVESDVAGMPHLIIEEIIDTIINIITVIVVFYILIRIDFLMGMITVVAYPFIILINIFYGKKAQEVTLKFKINQDRYLDTLQESFLGYKTTKVYHMESTIKNKIFSMLQVLYKNRVELIYILTTNSILFKTISLFFYFTVFLIGIRNVLENRITVGELVTFNVYITLLTESLLELTQLPRFINQNIVSVLRILELKTKTEDSDYETSEKIINTYECVKLENITFSYKNEHQVIEQFSTEFKKGKMNYIIGNVGSGKSTILKLISGFFADYEGSIFFNQIDIRRYSIQDLLDSVTYVTQEDFFFNMSIKENLIGDNNNSSIVERMHDYCMRLGIHDYIMSLPNGYETDMKNDSFDISKGQKQLLSLVRAFVWKKDILLIDEMTASLDVETEQKVITVLKDLCSKCLIILVTHREIDDDKRNNIVVINDKAG